MGKLSVRGLLWGICGVVAAFGAAAFRLAQIHPALQPVLHLVPRKKILIAAGRVLLSQTPFNDPAREPLPEFADRWFERWERGGDVTHWYTGELVG